MRKFTLLWFGYLISAIGTRMADFAITLWVWEETGSATAIALTGVFYKLLRVITSLFAGIWVDRANRQHLMILSEAIAAASTMALLLLYLSGQLAIWHLYAAALINGGFEKFGLLAYRASVTLLVKPENYARATSMNTAIGYGAGIVAPALAGMLYPIVGLGGIWPINLATFAFSIAVIARLTIPQPPPDDYPAKSATSRLTAVWQEATFGLRYVWNASGLRTLLIVTTSFLAALQCINTFYEPLILARTDGSSQALGAVSTIAGIGGVTGAIALSVWGGFRQNARGMLAGYVGAGFANLVFGLGRSLSVWLPAEFLASLCFPLIWSSEAALWMRATPAKIQGRVFTVGFLVEDLVEIPIALLAGVLGDSVLEPAMQSSAVMQTVFGPIVGTGMGSGMALLYVGGAIALVFVGLVSWRLPHLRNLEKSNT